MTAFPMKRRRGLQPEERLHLAVAKFLAVALRPPTFWTSIDAGAGKLSKRSAGMMKARGVKRGIPDILIFSPVTVGMAGSSHVIGIELKSASGRVSADQVETAAYMQLAGVRCRIARSVDQVQAILIANGIPIHARISGYRVAA